MTEINKSCSAQIERLKNELNDIKQKYKNDGDKKQNLINRLRQQTQIEQANNNKLKEELSILQDNKDGKTQQLTKEKNDKAKEIERLKRNNNYHQTRCEEFKKKMDDKDEEIKTLRAGIKKLKFDLTDKAKNSSSPKGVETGQDVDQSTDDKNKNNDKHNSGYHNDGDQQLIINEDGKEEQLITMTETMNEHGKDKEQQLLMILIIMIIALMLAMNSKTLILSYMVDIIMTMILMMIQGMRLLMMIKLMMLK